MPNTKTVDRDKIRMLITGKPNIMNVTKEVLLYFTARIDIIHVGVDYHMRARMEEEAARRGLTLYLPPLSLCGDNGAMVGAQAYYEYRAGARAGLDLNAAATMPIA